MCVGLGCAIISSSWRVRRCGAACHLGRGHVLKKMKTRAQHHRARRRLARSDIARVAQEHAGGGRVASGPALVRGPLVLPTRSVDAEMRDGRVAFGLP